jgi:hypothetical protein
MRWLTQDMRVSRCDSPARTHHKKRTRGLRVRGMFGRGLDTSRIACLLGITEADVIRQLYLTEDYNVKVKRQPNELG